MSQTSEATAAAPAVPDHEERNLWLLAVHTIVLRVGWIFKTESVIMPAFLDFVAGAGWIRGFLPVLNRFGQSVPPFFFARTLKLMPRKKWALMGFISAMSLPFFTLAGMAFYYRGSQWPAWSAAAFLALYALFFICTGLSMLSMSTLQGKLIRATRRGRLMALSSIGGTIPAVCLALLVLPYWLTLLGEGGYGLIFVTTASCFLLATIPVWFLVEAEDDYSEAKAPWRSQLLSSWRVVVADPAFGKFVPVIFLFAVSLMLFPHYQALAREELGLSDQYLLVWLVTQNIGVGIGGIFLGSLADRHGQRITLRVILFMMTAVPLLAVLLGYLVPSWGKYGYWMVFACLGVTPLGLRTLNNYTLEIAPVEEHPRYIGTMGLCLGTPFLLSPLIGWLVDLVGFFWVFLFGAGLIFLGALLTFRLVEAREKVLKRE